MQSDELIRRLTANPEILYLVRHARNRARAAKLSSENVRELLLRCTTVEEADAERFRVTSSLPDGRLIRLVLKQEADRLVVITLFVVRR